MTLHVEGRPQNCWVLLNWHVEPLHALPDDQDEDDVDEDNTVDWDQVEELERLGGAVVSALFVVFLIHFLNHWVTPNVPYQHTRYVGKRG